MLKYMVNWWSQPRCRKLQAELLIHPQPDRGRNCSILGPRPFKDSLRDNNFVSSHICADFFPSSSRFWANYIPNYFVIRNIQISTDNIGLNRTCWNCHKTLKTDFNQLFCEFCNALQPVNKQANLFTILGIKQSYNLNQSELKQKFRNLQTLLHPDKFSSKPKKEQEISEDFSSLVNKAYSTLLNPLERGLYLLSLNNVSIEEGTTDVDKLFLMEIMERNEEIENESNPQKLNEFYKINREHLDLLIGKVDQAFTNNDIELAKKLLTEMKYYNTIEKKIKEIKQKHNIPD